MAEPLSICIEDKESGRFTQCEAVALGKPGLSLDPDGTPAWQAEDPGLLLSVADDGRLVMVLGAGTPAVRVRRAGRILDPGSGEGPTVLLDQDELELGDRLLRIHFHGAACSVAPPRPFVASEANAPRPEEETPVIPAPGGITQLPQHRPDVAPPVRNDHGSSPVDRSELTVRPEPPAPVLPPPRARRAPWVWIALVAVLAVGIAVYWLVLRTP